MGEPRKGWSDPLIKLTRRLVDAYKAGWHTSSRPTHGPYIMGIEGGRQASINHRKQAWGTALAWAAMYGTREDYLAARATVLEWLRLERTDWGWWRNEQFAASSHAGQHLNGLVAASIGLAVAEERWGPDPELRAAIEQAWRDTWALCDLGTTPGGSVVLPGARQPKGPDLEPLSACNVERINSARLSEQSRILLGNRQGQFGNEQWVPLTHRGALRKPDRWALDYYAAVDGLRALLARGAVPTDAAPTLPRLRHRMVVYRGLGWHAATVEPPAKAGEWVRWCYVDHRAHDRGQKPLTGVEWGAEPADPEMVEEWRAVAVEVLRTP